MQKRSARDRTSAQQGTACRDELTYVQVWKFTCHPAALLHSSIHWMHKTDVHGILSFGKVKCCVRLQYCGPDHILTVVHEAHQFPCQPANMHVLARTHPMTIKV